MSSRSWIEAGTAEDAPALRGLMGRGTDHVWTLEQALAAAGPTSGRALLVTRTLSSVGSTDMTGFCALQVVGDEAEIHELVVAPEVRRQGIGRALAIAALGLARRRGAATMELEVRPSNRPAWGLYAALGFVQIRRRRGYYRTPDEDAAVLARVLSPGAGLTVSDGQ